MRRSKKHSDLGGKKMAIVSMSYTGFVLRNSEKLKKKNSSENKYVLIPPPQGPEDLLTVP